MYILKCIVFRLYCSSLFFSAFAKENLLAPAMLDTPFSISTSCYGFVLIVLCVLDLVWVPVLLGLRLWIWGQQNNNLIAWVLASRCAVAQGDIVESDTLLHFMCNILVLYTGTLTPPLLKLPEHLGARAQPIPRILCYCICVSFP